MTEEKRFIDVGNSRFEIHPGPTDDEAAAIVAAVTSIKRRVTMTDATALPGWRLAARREGLHAGLDAGRDGWRRAALLET